MVLRNRVSLRYAKAIFDYLGDRSKTAEMIEELRSVASLLAEHQELSLVFASSVFTETQRNAIIDDFSKKMKLSRDAIKILKVLSRSKRLALAGSIADALHSLLLQSQDVVAVRIEAALPLKPPQKKALERQLGALFGKKIDVTYIQNPSLIAGLRVSASGRTYDGTVSGWLDKFEERLAGP